MLPIAVLHVLIRVIRGNPWLNIFVLRPSRIQLSRDLELGSCFPSLFFMF